MDFEVSKFSSGFVFNNPNQVGACGCGESVNLQPADMTLLSAKDDDENAENATH
jgi:iron-sulfur cluster assembly protein